MHAPIHLPQADPVPAAVLDAERAILSAEGPCHVDGRYYAREADANQQRRWAAERMVRESTRRAQWGARAAARAPLPLPRVATWLTARERQQVDAAASACLALVHRDGLPAILSDLATGRADAVLVSAALVRSEDATAVARLVRGFPGVAVAGVLADSVAASAALAAAHLFGRAGVPTVIDCRTATGPSGWGALRGAFAPTHLPHAFLRACVARVLADVREGVEGGEGDDAASACTDGLVRLFVAAFAPDVTCAKQLAARLGVLPSTLTSRFFRAGLPSPKRYIAFARLVWAARLGESPALSLSAIACRLDASSPQSFHRTVRTLTGRSAAEFRRTTTGAAMLDQYRATLVAPYRDRLRTFDPTGADDDAALARLPRDLRATPVSTGRAA